LCDTDEERDDIVSPTQLPEYAMTRAGEAHLLVDLFRNLGLKSQYPEAEPDLIVHLRIMV
jgi:hypothetical protein